MGQREGRREGGTKGREGKSRHKGSRRKERGEGKKQRSESKGAVCKGDCDGNVIREVQCMVFRGGGAESAQEAPSASNLG